MRDNSCHYTDRIFIVGILVMQWFALLPPEVGSNKLQILCHCTSVNFSGKHPVSECIHLSISVIKM